MGRPLTAHRRHPAQVFEQFPRFERAGAVIGVMPNGQRAVNAIRPDLMQAILDRRMDVRSSLLYDDRGAPPLHLLSVK